MPKQNPFTPTFGAPPPLMVGRDDIIERVLAALHRGPRHPDYTLLLTGRRGTGKTALLDAIEAAARNEGWLTVSATASAPELGAQLRHELSALAEGLQQDPKMRLASAQAFGFGVSWGKDRPTHRPSLHELSLRGMLTGITDMLEQSADKKSADGRGLLITLDEFHAAEQREARELAATIQHVTRREQRPVALVLAALPEITETVLADPGMTFFHRCARGEIGLLDYGATETALQVPIREAAGSIDTGALDLATRVSGGYPFMVQLVGFHGWESCTESLKHLGINDIHEGIFEADQALTDMLLMPLWSALSPTDRDILRHIAVNDGPIGVAALAAAVGKSPSYINTYRRRLLRAGAVTAPDRGVLDVRDPTMRRWLQGLRPIADFDE
ncbi:MAG: ATP-binding protein [Acidimicrobiaceae bacterium]|nr:ATP-binding protein [Acidimicrobiaceae bacterium]